MIFNTTFHMCKLISLVYVDYRLKLDLFLASRSDRYFNTLKKQLDQREGTLSLTILLEVAFFD
jgi:hypothetical protein